MEGPELLVKISRGQQDHIDLAEVMCPICLSVLIEPVKMPCDHILCMPCFQKNVDMSSLNCPICRQRISVWCRRARKDGTLVFEELWKILQDKFSARVEARQAGLDDVDADDIIPCLPMHQFVDNGAIKEEFDQQMSQERREMVKVKTEEDRKSVEMIKKMNEEEREGRESELDKKRQQEMKDMEMARRIMDGEGDSPKKTIVSLQTGAVRGKENKASSNRGPIDSFFGISEPSKKKSSFSNFSTMSPFTRPQKYESKQIKPNVERCPSTESIQSNNSIDAELNHFKPIRSAPLSPPKRLPDGSEFEPEVIKTTPRNLSDVFSSSPGPSYTRQSKDSSFGGRQSRSSLSTRKELDVPDISGSKTPSSSGEPESLFCDETLRLTLTPTPSPGLKRPTFSSCDNHASPVFKCSLDMDTQELEELMDQDYGNFDTLDPSIIEEQKRMEEQIKQQIADEKYAKELQEEMDQQDRLVNRTKGSADEYNLRDSAKKLSTKSRLPLSPRTPRNGKSKLAMSPKTPGMSGAKSLAMTPKTPGMSGARSRLAMSPRTPKLSGVKRMRDKGIDEEEGRSSVVKKSRQSSLLETFKKKPKESSGNESEEF